LQARNVLAAICAPPCWYGLNPASGHNIGRPETGRMPMHHEFPAWRRQVLCYVGSVTAAMTMLSGALSTANLDLAPWQVLAVPATEVAVTETLVGLWSRTIPIPGSSSPAFRLVVELRADGSYTSGICSPHPGGCLRNEATASIQGTYTVRGETFTTDQGFVNLQRDRPFPNVDARKSYRWRVERDPPDDPPFPGSRPPMRTLRVTVAEGEELVFGEMRAEYRVHWVKRADR
jgi:hypothetical protein